MEIPLTSPLRRLGQAVVEHRHAPAPAAALEPRVTFAESLSANAGDAKQHQTGDRDRQTRISVAST